MIFTSPGPRRDGQVDVAEGQLPLPFEDKCAHLSLHVMPEGARLAHPGGKMPPLRTEMYFYAAQSSAAGGGMAPVMIATASDIE